MYVYMCVSNIFYNTSFILNTMLPKPPAFKQVENKKSPQDGKLAINIDEKGKVRLGHQTQHLRWFLRLRWSIPTSQFKGVPSKTHNPGKSRSITL